MELQVMNPFSKDASAGSLQAARFVSGHSSLIWTERFSQAGDFTRTSNDIAGTLAQLPTYTIQNGTKVPTFVCLRDSPYPMIVENHKIEKAVGQAPVITTTGRTCETLLDRRSTVVVQPDPGKPYVAYTADANTATDFATSIIQIVLNGTNNPADKIEEINFQLNSLIRPDGYQPVMLSDNVTPRSTSYTADLGELYAWALAQITSEGYGFRMRRPTVSENQLMLEIYTGRDRTKQVVFDVRFDVFDDAQYLLSETTLKNVEQINAGNDHAEVTDGEEGITGLNRRVIFNDQSSQLTTDGFPVGDLLTQAMNNLATVDLAKNVETVLFSGTVSRQIKAQYGDAENGYLLGDIVRLSADYGLSQYVQIAEFVRAEDNTGEKAYPTFASVNTTS